MTGSAAAGPKFPRPRTADPSVTTATVLRLMVKRRASEGSFAIAWQIRATPGVYARERSSRVFSGTLDWTSSFPPRCNRKVLSETFLTFRIGEAESAAVIFSAWLTSIASQVTSITTFSSCDSATSSAVIVAPSREMIVVISATG